MDTVWLHLHIEEGLDVFDDAGILRSETGQIDLLLRLCQIIYQLLTRVVNLWLLRIRRCNSLASFLEKG